jgi:hypothetical protein
MSKRKYGSALGPDVYATQLRLSRVQEMALKEYAEERGLTISQTIRDAINLLIRAT